MNARAVLPPLFSPRGDGGSLSGSEQEVAPPRQCLISRSEQGGHPPRGRWRLPLPALPRGRWWRVPGFTLIELMVVVAIIVLALGIMAPSLLEYFRNQKLKSVRSHFSSALTIARLMAITERSPIRVVFFREGARVYHVQKHAFRQDDEFSPESAPGSAQGITFNLRFAQQGGLPNSELPAFREWEKDPKQAHLNEVPSPANLQAGQCDVNGLVGVEFERDGSVRWLKGSDVPTSLYKKDPPMDADIIVEQTQNSVSLYIDIRSTGSIQTQFAPSMEGR